MKEEGGDETGNKKCVIANSLTREKTADRYV